ncbi:metal cation symporter ZIP14-like [Montipora foliosa]|uniref:metal cation symporter ZIP14-like n=1 Tax=Montipora foliosa TaxID=591990 RepID=UPI0035F1AD60
MTSHKSNIFLLFLLNFGTFIFTHDSRKHEYYSFKDLREAVNGDVLTFEDQQRLFKSLHLLNCTENKSSPDYRQCFTHNDLHNFDGSSPSKTLNATEFTKICPVILFCLLPALDKNGGGHPCSHADDLFNVFVSNYSEGEQGITSEALDNILGEINKSIGLFFTKKKCFSAESIIREIKAEGKTLDQHDFGKACASIILHLVQGYCIGQGQGYNGSNIKLPSKAFFIVDIFKGKSHLSVKDLEEIMTSLSIGQVTSTYCTEHNSHNHRRRRSATTKLFPLLESDSFHGVQRRAIGPQQNKLDGHHTNGTCYSLEDVINVFDVDRSTGADIYDFQQLCPAFLQQATSGACNHVKSHKTENDVEKDMLKIWGYGLVSVTLISVTSLAGVATIPFIGKKLYKKVLDMLVGLAVGSLAADSLLHLLPHSFGLHAHGEEGSFMWKATVVLGAIYIFYLFETLMHLGLRRKIGTKHDCHSHVDDKVPGFSSQHTSLENERASSFGKNKCEVPFDNKDIVLKNMTANGIMTDPVDEDKKCTSHQDKKSTKPSPHSPPSNFSNESGKGNTWKNISAVAWMIIIGDTLHNISDGLAIGAVFSEGGKSGISGGISTSIAVFCHELPHELGDFAVLLKAGMPVKMALLANFVSALSCFLGLVIGIEVGQQGEIRLWFFAIAGGIFLYVALVDMLPTLMHSEALENEPLVTFVLQNAGLLLGFGILLIIALYEEDLTKIQF